MSPVAPPMFRIVMVLAAAGTMPIQVGWKQSVVGTAALQTPFATSGSRAKLTYSRVTSYWPGGRLVALEYQSLRLTCALRICVAPVISARSVDPFAKEMG